MSAPDPGLGRPTPTPGSQPAHSPDTRPDPTPETPHRGDKGTADRRQFGMAMRLSGWLASVLENVAAPVEGRLGVRLLPTPNSAEWPAIELRTREGTFLLTVAYHDRLTGLTASIDGSGDGGGCGA